MRQSTEEEIHRAVVALRLLLDEATRLFRYRNAELERKEKRRVEKERIHSAVLQRECPDCGNDLLVVAEKNDAWMCEHCKREWDKYGNCGLY